jgi:hypothetical protein
MAMEPCSRSHYLLARSRYHSKYKGAVYFHGLPTQTSRDPYKYCRSEMNPNQLRKDELCDADSGVPNKLL